MAALRTELPWPDEALLHRMPPWRTPALGRRGHRPPAAGRRVAAGLAAAAGQELVTPELLRGPRPGDPRGLARRLDTAVRTARHRRAHRPPPAGPPVAGRPGLPRRGRRAPARRARHPGARRGAAGRRQPRLEAGAGLAPRAARGAARQLPGRAARRSSPPGCAPPTRRCRCCAAAAGLRAYVPGSARGHDALLTDGHLGRGPLGAPAAYADSPLAPRHLEAEVPGGHGARRAGRRCAGHRARTAPSYGCGTGSGAGALLVVLVAPGTGVWERRHWVTAGIMPRLAAAVTALPHPAELLVAESYPGAAAAHGAAGPARRPPGHGAGRGAAGRAVRGGRGGAGRAGRRSGARRTRTGAADGADRELTVTVRPHSDGELTGPQPPWCTPDRDRHLMCACGGGSIWTSSAMRAACVARPAEFASSLLARAAPVAAARAPREPLRTVPVSVVSLCCSRLRRRPPVAAPTQAELLDFVRRTAADAELIASLPLDPEGRTWVRLEGPGGSEAWLIGWPPGTGTGWHDHAESRRRLRSPRPASSRRTRSPPGCPPTAGRPSNSPTAWTGSGELATGQGRAFGRHHVHEVLNESTERARGLRARLLPAAAADPPLQPHGPGPAPGAGRAPGGLAVSATTTRAATTPRRQPPRHRRVAGAGPRDSSGSSRRRRTSRRGGRACWWTSATRRCASGTA